MASTTSTRRRSAAKADQPLTDDGRPIIYGKVPPRRVSGADFYVDTEDGRYYPHYEEWIEFNPGVGIDTVLMASQLGHLFKQFEDAGGEEGAPEELAERVNEALTEVSRAIHGAIRRWQWTDDSGQPFPERPRLEDIRTRDLDEILFLANAAFGDLGNEAGGARLKD